MQVIRLAGYLVFLFSLLSPGIAQQTKVPPSSRSDFPYSERVRLNGLSISSKIRASFDNGVEQGKRLKVENERLNATFKDHHCSCILTELTDGSITDLAMYKHSGSKTIDEKALSLIKQAAPFNGSLNQPLRCVVYFPSTIVRTYAEVVSPIQGIP